MSLLKTNEIQVFNGTTVTITATTAEVSADLNVGADLDVTGALTLGTALAIAEGGTGATDAATARINLDVDQAGTDNSTDVSLVTTSHDYLSIAGQAITLGPIDLTADVTGTLPIANGGTGQTTAAAARIALLPTLGTAGQVLAVNTGATDVEWVNAATGVGYGTVTSVAISGTDGIEVDSGSPITTSGTIALGVNAATLSSHLSLGTAATTAATDYATAAQGSLADSAVQPGDDAADLGSGAATDGYVLTADGAGGAAWEAASGGGASLPIDLLSSGASIRKSDGTTAVLSESGGAVTLENASLGDTVLMPDNSNNVSTAPGIRFEADTDTGIGLASAGNLAVVTGGTERMRIDSSGNLFVGTTSSISNEKLAVKNNSNNAISIRVDGSWWGINQFNYNAGSQPFQAFRYGTTLIGAISGNNTSTTYGTSSDYRLKEDWQPMSGSIDRLKALNPVNFAWKADGSRVDGFLAHEAQEVVPEAVTGTKDAVDEDGNPEYQGVDYGRITPLLTAALQEAVSKIDMLEKRIAQLESK